MVLKDASSMIQFQANHRRRDVIFIERNFHEFGPEHSTDSFSDYSRVPVDPEEQDVAVDHRPDDRQVGATYEDNFLREFGAVRRETAQTTCEIS